MGIFNSRLSKNEQLFLEASSSALTEIKTLNIAMLDKPNVFNAEAVIKCANRFSGLVTSSQNHVKTLSW